MGWNTGKASIFPSIIYLPFLRHVPISSSLSFSLYVSYNLLTSRARPEYSLVGTVKQIRPDLLGNHPNELIDRAIPNKPPAGFFNPKKEYVEGIGEPMKAAFLTLTNLDPTSWYDMENDSVFLHPPPKPPGGCLKNMMAFVPFGIPPNTHSFQDTESNLGFHHILCSPCRETSSSMARYGNVFFEESEGKACYLNSVDD